MISLKLAFLLFFAVSPQLFAQNKKNWQTLGFILGLALLFSPFPFGSFLFLGLYFASISQVTKAPLKIFSGLSLLAGLLIFFFPSAIFMTLFCLLAVYHHSFVLLRFNLRLQVLLLSLEVLLLVLFGLSPPFFQLGLVTVFFLILIFSNALLHYLYQETDMVYARSLDQIMANYVQEVNELYGQIRGWRHDYHNHLQLLEAHLRQENISEALAYLKELADSLGQIDQIVKSGNTMLDTVVNSKLTIAERKDIPVNVKVFVGSQPLAHEVDLVVILGNLLDNALEANLEIENPEKRMLRIYISILHQQLYITITNARSETQEILPDFASTKNDKRGLGIRRINSLVAKYQGIINRQYEEGFFVTEVLLPLENISS